MHEYWINYVYMCCFRCSLFHFMWIKFYIVQINSISLGKHRFQNVLVSRVTPPHWLRNLTYIFNRLTPHLINENNVYLRHTCKQKKKEKKEMIRSLCLSLSLSISRILLWELYPSFGADSPGFRHVIIISIISPRGIIERPCQGSITPSTVLLY